MEGKISTYNNLNEHKLLGLCMMYLVLTLMLFTPGASAEEGSDQGLPPSINVPLPAEECVEKNKETLDLIEDLEGGLMGTMLSIIKALDSVCKIKSAIMLVMDALQFFVGCICVISWIPGGQGVCEGVKAFSNAVMAVFTPLEVICCYLTNGICGLLVCGGSDDADFFKNGIQKINESVKNSEILFLQNCGHLPTIERPKITTKKIKNFFLSI